MLNDSYTHRVAISNERILAVDQHKVDFRWKDYRERGQQGVLTLPGADFIRRFLSHVLPSRFVKIRYYGFLANCHRRRNLVQCRAAFPNGAGPLEPTLTAPNPAMSWKQLLQNLTGHDLTRCPSCHSNLAESPDLQPSELLDFLKARWGFGKLPY